MRQHTRSAQRLETHDVMQVQVLVWLAGLVAVNAGLQDHQDDSLHDAHSHYGFAIHTDHSEQYSERGDDLGHQPSEAKTVKKVVVTKAVPYLIPQAYPVTIEKKVPYAVKVPVQVPVDKPYEVAVLKPYTVPVDRPVPYTVEKPVPYPVKVAVKVPVPQPVPYEVFKPYAVDVPVIKPYKVAVPVYLKAKEQGGKVDYASHVKFGVGQPEIKYGVSQPEVKYGIPQLDAKHGVPHTVTRYGVSAPEKHEQYEVSYTTDTGSNQAAHASREGDHQVGGFSEHQLSYAPSDLDMQLAALKEKGGSYSYVYRQ